MELVINGKYDETVKAIVDDWISQVLIPTKTINPTRTGYGLKHCLQFDTGIYLFNEEFARAMRANGFKSKPAKYSFGENDCHFNVKPRLKQYHGEKFATRLNLEVVKYGRI